MVKKQRDLFTHLLGPESAASGGKGSVILLSHGIFTSCFQGREGGSECLLELAVSEVSLIQNN